MAAAPVLKDLGSLAAPVSDREVTALEPQLRATDELMAAPGIDATPVTACELEWLLHRSCSLGLPGPGHPRRGRAGELGH